MQSKKNFSLTSQAHFHKKGKGLVNCIYPNGMQLARWHNQISNNALLKYCHYRSCENTSTIVLWEHAHFATGISDILALCRCLQDRYCYSNSDVMCHVTRYCNVIGQHCTVWRDMACIRSSPVPLPFLLQKWVRLAGLDQPIQWLKEGAAPVLICYKHCTCIVLQYYYSLACMLKILTIILACGVTYHYCVVLGLILV